MSINEEGQGGRTLSGISNNNHISIPSTPEAIRIGGELGDKGYLVGIDIVSGDVAWVQAGTPFIPNNSILGVDLNENIGFETTASENGGVIKITNGGGTGTLEADVGVFDTLSITTNVEVPTIQAKTKFIAQALTDTTRKVEIDSSNGDIIQYQTYDPVNEYASIKSGVGAFRSLTLSGSITGATTINSSQDITTAQSINATANIIAGGNIACVDLGSSGEIEAVDLIATNIDFTTRLRGRRTKVDLSVYTALQITMDDDGAGISLFDGDGDNTISIQGSTGNIDVNDITCDDIETDGSIICGTTFTCGGVATFNDDLTIATGKDFNFLGVLSGTYITFNQTLVGNWTNSFDALAYSLIETTMSNKVDGTSGAKIQFYYTTPSGGGLVRGTGMSLDGETGTIDATTITTTNLTATNINFDNNLKVKDLEVDDIVVVNKDAGDTPTINLAGQTGSINATGTIESLNLQVDNDARISNNLDVIGDGLIEGDLVVEEDITARNITCSQADPNGVITCRKLIADVFEFDDNLITKELQSDRITLVDNANADAVTMVLDGGVNPDFPLAPAGSFVLLGSIQQLYPSNPAYPMPNDFWGGMRIGNSDVANPDVEVEINGQLTCRQQKVIIENGATINGLGVANNVHITSELLLDSANDNKVRKLNCNENDGYIMFGGSGEFLGNTGTPTICKNLDLRSVTNLVPDASSMGHYMRVWDPTQNNIIKHDGGMADWQNLLGYNAGGGRRNMLDLTFTSTGTTMYFRWSGYIIVTAGAVFFGLNFLHIPDNGTETLDPRTARLCIQSQEVDDRFMTIEGYIIGLVNGVDYAIAPAVFSNSTLPSTVVEFLSGPNSGTLIHADPSVIAHPFMSLEVFSLDTINYSRSTANASA